MMRRTAGRFAAGVSGLAVFAPPSRVDLQEWCSWTGNSWDKVSSVVGKSFRVPAHNENAYTMAATAALRLILNYDIDPRTVGFLGLGTESSTDNSAGAVIVRGMLDSALKGMGLPPLSRNCEVPEFKHACLGGVYAMKSAVRFAQTDGANKSAIVIASDVAEYARGSTGEQTQGAGATAMLVEAKARLFEVDLARTGSSSAYRGPDFRKPHKRHFMEGYDARPESGKIPDFPVFSGPYSTLAYLDAVTVAVEDMLQKLSQRPSEFYSNVQGLFFHRPYNMMPIQAMSFLYARGLARSTSAENREKFEALCAAAKVSPVGVRQELDSSPDFFEFIERGENPPDNSVKTNNVAKLLRKDKQFTDLLESKMSLGSATMANFGNLYTASLPCWVAAGFEEAQQRQLDLADKPMVLVGYGSGDASEAIPVRVVPGWEKQAAKIGAGKALENAVTISKEQYEGIHDGRLKEDLAGNRRSEFVVGSIGQRNEVAFQDFGIDYYHYITEKGEILGGGKKLNTAKA